MQSYRNLKPAEQVEQLCAGVRPGHKIPCNGTLYKCAACGNVGCRQTKDGNCTAQGFNVLFGCLKCGAVGKQELLTSF